ncbi:MAG: isocitrate lyase [Patescibacteria group bacterium]
MDKTAQEEIAKIELEWKKDRWKGIIRPYKAEDIYNLRGSLKVEYTWAKRGSEKLWHLLHERPFIKSFGALTGLQAVQMVKAGLEAIYVSGWQTAADMNVEGETYPDMSLYSPASVPNNVKRINQAFQRADHIQHQHLAGKNEIDWYAPIIADAEAGFGGDLNTHELVRKMIQAGAAAIHLEDQRSAVKKCGHMGGKMLVPVGEFINKLVAARRIADGMDVPLVIIARTDAEKADGITNDWDERDRPFLTGERTEDKQYYKFRGGTEACIARGLAYAPYADMLWMETSKPDLEQAKAFADAIHAVYPGKLLAYNCSPSFNWKNYWKQKGLSDKEIRKEVAMFQDRLGEMGYKFQFITLASFHLILYYTFMFSLAYKEEGMATFMDLQEDEFKAEELGYQAATHQEFVGTKYFDEVLKIITGGETSILGMKGSTEEEQFKPPK